MRDTTHYQHDDTSPYLAANCPLPCAPRTGTTVRVDDDVFTRRDGRLQPVAYGAAPITVEDHAGIVVVFTDVSARRGEEQRRKRELGTLIPPGRFLPAAEQYGLIAEDDP